MSVLSSPKTHVVNTMGNMGMFVLRNIEEDMVAGAHSVKAKIKGDASPVWESFKMKQHFQAASLKEAMGVTTRNTDGYRIMKEEVATAMAVAWSSFFKSKTFTKGDIIEICEDNSLAGDKAGEILAAYIPSLLNTLNQEIIEEYKRDRSIHGVNGWLDAIAAKTPGLSATVPPYYTRYGEPVVNELGDNVFARTAGVFDPILGKSEIKPLEQELSRLHVPVLEPSRKIGEYELTKKEWANLKKFTGSQFKMNRKTLRQAHEDLMKSKEYPKMSEGLGDKDGMKQKRFRKIETMYRRYGKLAWLQLPKNEHIRQAYEADRLKGFEALRSLSD